MSSDKLNELRRKAHDAVRAHKVFILKGYFHTVRKALTDRGWVEKMDGHRIRGTMGAGGFLLEDLVQALPPRQKGESKRAHIQKCERSIISRFLEHSNIDLLWCVRREKSDWTHLTKNQNILINRFQKSPFTSKEGLCMALKDFHWYYEEGKAETYFPRCFNVFNPEELSEFIENFRTTASVSFLRWFIETFEEKGSFFLMSDEGRVPLSSITFAINRCKDYIDYCVHNDIDIEGDIKIWEHDWDVFLTHHYLLTHENAKFLIQEDVVGLETFVESAKKILEKMKILWPQYGLDGTLNIWIIKPGNKCRGRGIILMNNIKQIISIVNPPISKSRYVVQKYIERPLVIHKTKFDIRQWFLLTSVQPLVVWFYKESYLRFSSQQYNLSNYHESVHLTNHAIQKKYSNGVRDDRLPNENMWDCHTFQAYLRQIGKFEMWNDKIYPGSKNKANKNQCLNVFYVWDFLGTMLACQENMDRRQNTFELYGADFMISEDFCPWLIEINASPDLAPSTSVTARLCPQAVEDTIKVVLDRRTDQNAETGYFEMIYKQIIPKTPAYMGLNLSLKGQRITPKCPQKREKSPNKSLHSIYTLARLASSSNRKPRNPNANGPTIMDFMQCLNFKTRLDREKDLLKKKIRSSTLYKKPNFSYSIYNPLNGNVGNNKISCISKNIKINEFKDDTMKKIKSPFATVVQETLKKPKTAKSAKSNCNLKDDNGGVDNSTATVADPTKPRKATTKLFKKSSNSHFFAVGLRMRSKYTDAIITEIENDLPTLTTLNENTVKKPPATDTVAKSSKKSGMPRKLYKKTTHNKKSDIKIRSAKTAKGVTKKIKTDVKVESSKVPVDLTKNLIFSDVKICEKFKALEARARHAINSKKIFTVIGGFEDIRQSLLERGWIERYLDNNNRTILSERLIKLSLTCAVTERLILSYMVRTSPVYFIWQPKYFEGLTHNIHYPIRNRLNRIRALDFTLKEGLHNCAENIQWHQIEEVSDHFSYQRSFLLTDIYKRDEFVQEYKRTEITSFLTFLNEAHDFEKLFDEHGTVPMECITIAIMKVEQYIKNKQHMFIDQLNTNEISQSTTNELLKNIHLIMVQKKKIKLSSLSFMGVEKLKAHVKVAIAEININWHQSRYDGHRNLWIVKPVNKARGYGVVLMKDAEKVLDHVFRHSENKYIAQKYIERPLLIYNTKFDIRQYFITQVKQDRVIVWFYKECYIKFSSQEFSLDNLHESIHLTNHAVQQFYKNGPRSVHLPTHNMWSLVEFLEYLRSINKEHCWNEKIFPSMKKNIVAVVLGSLEDMQFEENSFELNGADFMVGYDFEPIILEINANPDLTYTTKTTKDICTRVMQDVIKVIIDHSNDPQKPTGNFEIAHECLIPKCSNHSLKLCVDGKKLSPTRKPIRIYHLTRYSGLVVEGNKVEKPPKPTYNVRRKPLELNVTKSEIIFNKSVCKVERTFASVAKKQIGKKLIVKSPKRQPTRNLFQTVVVRPNSSYISNYVKSLPNVFNASKCINLSDLKQCLKLRESLSD
ncbi:unnamed protein product [Diamesa hyperborea]